MYQVFGVTREKAEKKVKKHFYTLHPEADKLTPRELKKAKADLVEHIFLTASPVKIDKPFATLSAAQQLKDMLHKSGALKLVIKRGDPQRVMTKKGETTRVRWLPIELEDL